MGLQQIFQDKEQLAEAKGIFSTFLYAARKAASGMVGRDAYTGYCFLHDPFTYLPYCPTTLGFTSVLFLYRNIVLSGRICLI